ncbi:MAG: hypothetical protein R6W77_07985 [Trueperaceae bacterium]
MSRNDDHLDVIAVFDHPSAANDAATSLVDAGLDRSSVRVIAGASEEVLRRLRQSSHDVIERGFMPAENGAALGFVAGFLGGGFLGLVMGSGAVNVMGKEAAMQAGPFWAAAIGGIVLGAAGALAGYFLNAPLPRLEPPHVTEGRRGPLTIVQAVVAPDGSADALEALDRHQPTAVHVWERDDGSWTPRAAGA